MSEPTQKADCYSDGERAAMEKSQELRARLLGPLLQALTNAGICADHITLLAFVVGLAFCPLYFTYPVVAFAMIALHVILDGLLYLPSRSSVSQRAAARSASRRLVVFVDRCTRLPVAGSTYRM